MQNSDDPQNNFLQSNVLRSREEDSSNRREHELSSAGSTLIGEEIALDEHPESSFAIGLPKKETGSLGIVIGVIGVGCAGCNAINNLKNLTYAGNIRFIACNTNKKSLDACEVDDKICLDEERLKGYGSGAQPLVGLRAAKHSIHHIMEAIAPLDMVFVLAGMGKGTGTGAAGLIAKAAREMGKLVVAIVSKPFHSHGTFAMNIARHGIFALSQYTDSLVVFDNQCLLGVGASSASLPDLQRFGDINISYTAISTVCDIIFTKGVAELDFNDIQTVLATEGYATIVSGHAKGEDKVSSIVEQITKPHLLDKDIRLDSPKVILLSIAVSPNLPYTEYAMIATQIRKKLNIPPDSNLFLIGEREDPNLEDEMKVSAIFAGIKIDNLNLNNGNNGFVGELRDFEIPNSASKDSETKDLFQSVHHEEPLLSDTRIEANVQETEKLKEAGLWPDEDLTSAKKTKSYGVSQSSTTSESAEIIADEKREQSKVQSIDERPSTQNPANDLQMQENDVLKEHLSDEPFSLQNFQTKIPEIVRSEPANTSATFVPESNAVARRALSLAQDIQSSSQEKSHERTTRDVRAQDQLFGENQSELHPNVVHTDSLSTLDATKKGQTSSRHDSLPEHQPHQQERRNLEIMRNSQRSSSKYSLPSSLQNPHVSRDNPYLSDGSGLLGNVLKKVTNMVSGGTKLSDQHLVRPSNVTYSDVESNKTQPDKNPPYRHHTDIASAKADVSKEVNVSERSQWATPPPVTPTEEQCQTQQTLSRSKAQFFENPIVSVMKKQSQ